MLCCFLKDDTKKTDALMVRIFGVLNTEYCIPFDRDSEIMAIQLAHNLGFGQKMYAIFKNGVVYGYNSGRTLTGEDISNPKVVR